MGMRNSELKILGREVAVCCAWTDTNKIGVREIEVEWAGLGLHEAAHFCYSDNEPTNPRDL